MKKNIEILPDFVLKDLKEQIQHKMEYRGLANKSDDEINEEINHTSSDEIVKNWLEWNGIINYHEQIMNLIESAFQVKLVREESKKKWCCWELDMEEILHAMQEVKVPDKFWLNASEDDREAFVDRIVESFKDSLSIMGEDWENALEESVRDVIIIYKDREDIDTEGFSQ